MTNEDQARLSEITGCKAASIVEEDLQMVSIMTEESKRLRMDHCLWILRSDARTTYISVLVSEEKGLTEKSKSLITAWITNPMANALYYRGIGDMRRLKGFKDIYVPTNFLHGRSPPRIVLEWEELVKLYSLCLEKRVPWAAVSGDLSSTIYPMCVHKEFQFYYQDCIMAGKDNLEISPRTRQVLIDSEGEPIMTTSDGYDTDVEGNSVQEGVDYQAWDLTGPSALFREIGKRICTAYEASYVEESRFTEKQMELITLLIAISTSKTFSQAGQKQEVVKARANAFCYSHCAFECMPEKVQEFLDAESLNQVGECLQQYPNMRISLYRTFLHGGSPAIDSTKSLLANHQLSTFNMICVFIENCPPTQAHFHPLVVKDLKIWSTVFTRLKSLYGEDWRFIKLFDPFETETATAQWPNLSATAYVYCSTLAGGASIKYIRNNKINRSFNVAKALATPVAEKFLDPNAKIKRGLGLMTEVLAELIGVILPALRAENDAKKWFDEVDVALEQTYSDAQNAMKGNPKE